MSKLITVEIPVDEAAAEVLEDADRRARMGRLVSQIARLQQGPDPLAAVLDRTARAAEQAGLTDEDVDAELSRYNSERRG
jgi:hypothetical protein